MTLSISEILEMQGISGKEKIAIENWFEQHTDELCQYIMDESPDYGYAHCWDGRTEKRFNEDVSMEIKAYERCVERIKKGRPKDYVPVCDRIN